MAVTKTKMIMKGEIEVTEDGKSVEVREGLGGESSSRECTDEHVWEQSNEVCARQMDDCGTEQHDGDEAGANKHEEDEHYDDPRELGRRGELAAVKYLQRRDIEVLERNWRCRYGEADIIALDDETIVFIEVKTRRGINKGIPEDAVTPDKRDRYEKIAASYLEQNDFVDCFVRFDVIAIMTVSNNRAFLRHHRGAFAHGD